MIREAILKWLLKAANRNEQIFAVLNTEHKQPQFNTWSTKKAIDEGFKASVWVYACVRRIITAVSSVPWIAYKKDSKGNWIPQENHPLTKLLERPNPFYSNNEFIERFTAYAQLGGNVYTQVIKVRGKPVELWCLRPDRITIVPDSKDYISHYIYNTGTQQITFNTDEIIHYKFIDPGNEYYGMSPLQAAAMSTDIDVEAHKFNKYAMENRGVLSGAVSTEQSLTEPQFERLKAQINERYKGSENARKIALFEAGLKWQDFAKSLHELDFIEGQKLTREEICAAFGVPPVLVGILDKASYSNYEQAEKTFWLDTIIPFLNSIRDKLNAELVPMFGEDNLWLNYDVTEIKAIQDDLKELVEIAEKLWKMGVPFDQINERLGLGFKNIPGGNIGYVPINIVPVNSNEGNQDLGESKSFFNAEFKAINVKDEDKEMYWKSFERQRSGWYKTIEKQVKNRFKEELKALEKAIEESQGINIQNKIDEVLNEQRKEWQKLILAIDMSVVEDFGKRVSEGFKNVLGPSQKKEFDLWAEEAQNWIAMNGTQKIKHIDETTRKNVQEQLSEGIANGEGIPELQKRLQELYERFNKTRAVIIARTEVIAASNAGSRAAALQTGLNLTHEWLSTPDNRTRDIHRNVNGQTKPLNEPFEVAGEKLMFPGDTTLGASASNVIQCRCTEIYNTI